MRIQFNFQLTHASIVESLKITSTNANHRFCHTEQQVKEVKKCQCCQKLVEGVDHETVRQDNDGENVPDYPKDSDNAKDNPTPPSQNSIRMSVSMPSIEQKYCEVLFILEESKLVNCVFSGRKYNYDALSFILFCRSNCVIRDPELNVVSTTRYIQCISECPHSVCQFTGRPRDFDHENENLSTRPREEVSQMRLISICPTV